MEETVLTDQQKAQLKSNLDSGMRILKGKHPDLDESDTHKTMEFLLEAIATDAVFLPEAAAVLCYCIEKAVGWKTVTLKSSRLTGTAVVSQDGAYATYPELVVGKAARNPNDSNLLLYFNMIKGGSLPPSSPGQYTVLS